VSALRPTPVPLAVLAGASMVLVATGLVPAWPGLLHVVALPPLDLVHDLGALVAHAGGWPAFLGGVAVSLVLRSLVLAALLGGVTRARFLFALRFYAAVGPLAFAAAALLYSGQALLFVALFWAGVALTVGLLLCTAALPWTAPPRLAAALRPAAHAGFRAGTVGAYLLALTLLGWFADAGGRGFMVALVPVSGALTWLAIRVLLEDPGWRVARRAGALAFATLALWLAALVLSGPAGPPEPGDDDPQLAGSILLMSGVDSGSGTGAILELDPRTLGWTCEQTYYFSYAGPGDGQPRRNAQCDIHTGAPYGPQDTLRPTEELIDHLAAQVRHLEPPAVVAGHSQAAWLVWEAASRGLLEGVDAIVLVGALPQNPVVYPEAGEQARGMVGRTVLGAITAMPRPGGTGAFEPDSPLGREWLASPNAVERTLREPLPADLRALSIASAFDLPLMPDGHEIPGATDACPVAVIHPNLPYSAELHDAVARFAAGSEPRPCPFWRTRVGAWFRHFAVPPSRW
jgi:hypothetical protein